MAEVCIPGILFVIVHSQANHVSIVHYVVVGKGGSLGGKRNENDEDTGLPPDLLITCMLTMISLPQKEVNTN